MKLFMTTGTHRFLPLESLAGFGAVWPEQVGMTVAMPAARGCGSAAAFAGSAGYHVRFRTLVNSISHDLPVTDRLRTSASEP